MKKGDKIHLSEYRSVRVGKKVKSEFVRYLGVESEQEKIPLPKKSLIDWKTPDRSSRAGDVLVLWEIAHEMRLAETIDRVCGKKGRKKANSPGKLLTLWAINRALEPESATQLEDWIDGTILPEISGLSLNGSNKDAFYAALDCVCSEDPASGKIEDNTKAIEEELYAIWRNKNPLPKGEKELLAYDMTSMMTYSKTCPLAEKGYNAEKWRHQQFNLSLLVSKYDHYPLAHMVHPGNHASMTTMQHLVPRLSDFSIHDGTMIWDRGNTSEKTVNALEGMHWKVICGVPKISQNAKEMVMATEIPETTEFIVPCKNVGELYACKIRAPLFGRMCEAAVYRNVKNATKSLVRRNRAIFEISNELTRLKEKGGFSSQKDLKSAIKGTLSGWSSFFLTEYPDNEAIVDFSWSIIEKRVAEAKSMDGKFLIYSTEESLTAQEIVRMYMEKDFIEKVFRTIKTDEELKPIRHRLESRVRAIIFIATLAYRLLSALRWMINSSESKDVTLSESKFLRKLSRVEKLEANLGKEVEIFYVNVTNDVKDQLVALGMKNLFEVHRIAAV